MQFVFQEIIRSLKSNRAVSRCTGCGGHVSDRWISGSSLYIRLDYLKKNKQTCYYIFPILLFLSIWRLRIVLAEDEHCCGTTGILYMTYLISVTQKEIYQYVRNVKVSSQNFKTMYDATASKEWHIRNQILYYFLVCNKSKNHSITFNYGINLLINQEVYITTCMKHQVRTALADVSW